MWCISYRVGLCWWHFRNHSASTTDTLPFKSFGQPRQFHVFHEHSAVLTSFSKGFSNQQLAFLHVNVPLEHRSDGGWTWSSVHLCRCSIKNLPFPARIVFYHINNVENVFMINLKLSSLKKTVVLKIRTFLSDPKPLNGSVCPGCVKLFKMFYTFQLWYQTFYFQIQSRRPSLTVSLQLIGFEGLGVQKAIPWAWSPTY